MINYKDDFWGRIIPILGMHPNIMTTVTSQKGGMVLSFRNAWEEHFIYGSLRDISHAGAVTFGPTYLNDEPGYEYTFGADFSDSRGGIKYANDIFLSG